MKVPLGHITRTLADMDGADPAHVAEFVAQLQAGKKLKPVIRVKTPRRDKPLLIDGHHRFLACAELAQPVRAYIGTADAEHGPWETMHDHQFGHGGRGDGPAAAAWRAAAAALADSAMGDPRRRAAWNAMAGGE